jgi:hypothetical protein
LAIEDGFNSQHRSFFHGYIKIPELDFSFFPNRYVFSPGPTIAMF